MSDLVVNIRQISSYPTKAAAAATDTLLLQQGGLGGPYYQTTPLGLLGPILGEGQNPPIDAGLGQLFAGELVTPLGGSWFWNAYLDTAGQARYWQAGPAAELSFTAATGWAFQAAPAGQPDQPIAAAAWADLLNLAPTGAAHLIQDTLTVARDPIAPLEVATMRYVQQQTVLPPTTFVSSTPPATPSVGALWFDTIGLQTYLWYSDPTSSQWVPVVNQPGAQGPQGVPGVGYHYKGQVATAAALPGSGNVIGDVWSTADTNTSYAWDGTKWNVVAMTSGLLPLAGGTMTGPLTLAADATQPLQAVTLQQMQSHIAQAVISATAPSSPVVGELWWDSTGGKLYIWFNDGTSSQWVSTSNAGNG